MKKITKLIKILDDMEVSLNQNGCTNLIYREEIIDLFKGDEGELVKPVQKDLLG